MRTLKKKRFYFLFALGLTCALLSPINFGEFSIAQEQKNSIITKATQSGDADSSWRAQSKLGARLIVKKKYAEANSLLASLIPQARSEAPHSLDFAILLARYGIGLYADKKYKQASPVLYEALRATKRQPATLRQEKAVFQILGALTATELNLNQAVKAEELARETIAYRIAFPHVAKRLDTKKSYWLLKASLEAQKKTGEAALIADIFNSL